MPDPDIPITSTMGVVISYDAGSAVAGVAYGGQVFEAADPLAIAPNVGDRVIIDFLPSQQQFMLVGTFV